ncbi:MOSC domain-containing protein [Bacillus sp. D-CC]
MGDTFKLGQAIVQVTQPRQPCFKLAKKYNIPKLPLYFLRKPHIQDLDSTLFPSMDSDH